MKTHLPDSVRQLIEALEIARNQLRGVQLAIEKHGQNIDPQFFIEYYKQCADKADEAISAYMKSEG